MEQQRKLLLIDDDTIVRQSVAAYLEDSGFSITQAADGQSALAAFDELSPDLVLTDLRMPGIDGLQVIERIQQSSPHTPVIVMSGAGVMGDVVEALRLGASDYLVKPVVDMQMLEHSIHKSIERRDLLSQNQRYREELEEANRDLREHVEVLERDQQAGRQVQLRLLPPTPTQKGGYGLAHHIVPSLYLSGDFIDYAYKSERYIAFYLADVSGHGASSAFATVWLKDAVNRMVATERLYCSAESFETGTNKMFQRINSELKESRLNHHITCVTGVIDTHSHRLRYSVAGHLPMPVLIHEGKAEYLDGRGKPLGIFDDVEWPVYQMDFPAGARLATFSDGVLEILPPKSLCEKEAYLLASLAETDGSLEAIRCKLSIDEVKDAPDDIALIVIGREG